jgi:hypothetical protein
MDRVFDREAVTLSAWEVTVAVEKIRLPPPVANHTRGCLLAQQHAAQLTIDLYQRALVADGISVRHMIAAPLQYFYVAQLAFHPLLTAINTGSPRACVASLGCGASGILDGPRAGKHCP